MSRNWSYSSLSILLLFICLIAVNVVAYYLPMRADMTAEKLYTISEGSRSILSGLKDPLRIKYYFSASSEELPPYIKNYAERVREVLEEYENLSSGRITLETFDPKPDTEEEEWAERYGINAVTLPQGSRLYFGAVVLMLDQEMTLPFFDPRRERFLEYDLTQAIYKVSQTERPKIGILSTLNLSGGRSMIPGQRPAEKWVFLGEMEKTMEVVNLPLDTEEVSDEIGLLLVMPPKEFSDSLIYAIDQFPSGLYDCDGICYNDNDPPLKNPDGLGDGICDEIDNCPDVYNPDQFDFNDDEIGDACDGVGLEEGGVTKELIKVTDVLGREIQKNTKGSTLMYWYNTGEVEIIYNFK